MMTEPSACLAILPVSTVKSRSPSLMVSFKFFFTGISCVSFDNVRAHVSSVARLKSLESGVVSLESEEQKLFAFDSRLTTPDSRLKQKRRRTLRVKVRRR